MSKAAHKIAGPAAPIAILEKSGDVPVVPVPWTKVEIAVTIVAVVAAIAAARIAEAFIVPVLAGILLSYTLRPLVSRLEHARIPRGVGAVLVLATLVAILSATGYAIRDDVSNAVAELPNAAHKLRNVAVEAARKPAGPVSHVNAAAAELDRAAAEVTGKPPTTVAPAPAGIAAQAPIFLGQQTAQALTLLAQVFVILLLTLFLLAAGDTFRRKVAKLAGHSLARRRVTVDILNDIDGQIQKYMLTLLTVNVLIALVTWGGLALVGLPNAGMWGAMTGALHIIPYAGTIVAVGVVGIATFIAGGGVSDAVLAMALIAGIAAVFGVGVATWLQGRSAKMNAVAAFIGVLFFGWLWGAWGLFLGMPLLAVLKSISDRVDSMRPVSELLGP